MLCAISGCFGTTAAGLGIYYHSWLVFVIAIAAILPLDMLMDFCFYRLEVIDQK
jgi:hypothetical protein